MVQELRSEAFDHAVGIVDAQLKFIDKKAVSGRFAFEKGDGAFSSTNPTDERAGKQSDDAEMGNEKGHVMFFHGQRENAETVRFVPNKTSQRLNQGAP